MTDRIPAETVAELQSGDTSVFDPSQMECSRVNYSINLSGENRVDVDTIECKSKDKALRYHHSTFTHVKKSSKKPPATSEDYYIHFEPETKMTIAHNDSTDTVSVRLKDQGCDGKFVSNGHSPDRVRLVVNNNRYYYFFGNKIPEHFLKPALAAYRSALLAATTKE